MSIEQQMLHVKKEEMLLQKVRQRWEEFGKFQYWSPRQIEDIQIRETTEYEKIENALKAKDWRSIRVGDEWAGNGEFAWFKMKFTVPKEFAGKTLVAYLRFGAGGWLGGEGCLFINGVPYQGIDPNHPDVILAEKAKAGETYELVCECVSSSVWKNELYKLKFEQADIAVLNHEMKDYWYDLGFITGVAEALPEGSRRRSTIIRTANKSVDAFDTEFDSFDALSVTAKQAAKVLTPLYKSPAEGSALEYACAGHSHIDVAWLWPYAETIRKCSRTFSTVDRLMEEYPEYLFTQSQAQLFEFTKEHYPELYEKIKKRVKERRFEPQGSMWVEADCNISSGESLVRQILLGKTYFLDEFDIETNILWLPDVFGYSAALPQILKKSDVDNFMTIKISWSQFNKFPYSSFWWEGIDGSRVLAHFPPTNDYNARIDPRQMRTGAEDYREKDLSDIALYPFGYGDGGGGPTREHIEHMKRATNLEGVPKCTPMWAGDFFKELSKRSEDLPSWVGELYLEFHRGTYTTQSRNKKANRNCELLLHDAEFAASLAWMLKKAKYPNDDIIRAWKMTCKHQFHDVIPGTSVTDVYEDTAAEYKEIAEIGEKIVNSSLDQLAGKSKDTGNITLINSLSWDRSDAVKVNVPGKASDWQVETANGQVVASQPSNVEKSALWISPDAVPGLGFETFKLVKGKGKSSSSSIKVSTGSMENQYYRIKLDKKGLIISIFDKKAEREVLPKGANANVFQLFEDKPLAWDAWDVDFYYRDKGKDITELAEIAVEDEGSIRGSIRIKRNFGSSMIEQRIVIWNENPRIDFETKVDWHESKKMLKVAFPVDVHTDKARFEIQFGSVDRPTHWNTSWDFARLEVAAQKWVDMSQADYGMSLLNDCKYGHDVHENVLKLTLLRSPKEPDPQADMGEHYFTYSILPHEGDWRNAQTVQRAYELNVPMMTWISDATPSAAGSVLSIDAPNVIIETVKKAEKEDALVVRMYECWGIDADAVLSANLRVKKAVECNLLERNQSNLDMADGMVRLKFKPFEIKTVKLQA